MIAINRENEVVIEDGMSRLVVYADGSGFLHENGNVHEVELHDPVHLIAARNSGMDIADETIARSQQMVDERYFG